MYKDPGHGFIDYKLLLRLPPPTGWCCAQLKQCQRTSILHFREQPKKEQGAGAESRSREQEQAAVSWAQRQRAIVGVVGFI